MSRVCPFTIKVETSPIKNPDGSSRVETKASPCIGQSCALAVMLPLPNGKQGLACGLAVQNGQLNDLNVQIAQLRELLEAQSNEGCCKLPVEDNKQEEVKENG